MSHTDDLAFMSASLDNTDIDLSMRAPYIPMNDDLALPEDLMWSEISDELSLHNDIKEASALQQQPLHLQSTLPTQQFGPDPVEQMIIDGAINGNEQTNNDGDEHRMMFGTVSNLANYLVSKYIDNDTSNIDCKQQNIANEILKMESNPSKYDIVGNNNTAIEHNSQQIIGKSLNDENLRSITPTHMAGDPSKMDVLDAISDDGFITTYTIQMFDNDVFTKNG